METGTIQVYSHDSGTKCASPTVMKENKKITAGRKEMYHREENVMNMALVCSSCRSSALFVGIIIPCFFGGGYNIAGKVTWRTLN